MMTEVSLALETCMRMGIRDPAELYALPDPLPEMWMEHTRNMLTNGYSGKEE